MASRIRKGRDTDVTSRLLLRVTQDVTQHVTRRVSNIVSHSVRYAFVTLYARAGARLIQSSPVQSSKKELLDFCKSQHQQTVTRAGSLGIGPSR